MGMQEIPPRTTLPVLRFLLVLKKNAVMLMQQSSAFLQEEGPFGWIRWPG